MKQIERYGILDDENQVIRWIDEKPDDVRYRFVIQQVDIPNRNNSPGIDWNNFEPALI